MKRTGLNSHREPVLRLHRLLLTALAVAGGSLSACNNAGKLFSTETTLRGSDSSFSGCAGGSGVSTSSIQINFNPPVGATKITITRNGTKIFSTSDMSLTSYTDSGLNEGHTYAYICSAMIKGISNIGASTAQISTLTVNAPSFTGISTATAVSASIMRVTWPTVIATGVPAATFKIYQSPGGILDWTGAPFAEIANSGTTYDVTGRSDEVPYIYGVRACSASGVCDTNMTTIIATTPDGGPPTTIGATAAVQQNGVVTLTAPWDFSKGGLLKRKVYVRTGVAGGTNLGLYTLHQTTIVADAGNPPTSIPVLGLSEYVTYHFILIDEDPSGNTNTVQNPLSVAVTDLTQPIFPGLTSLTLGSFPESTLKLTFVGIDREVVENPTTGAAQYLVYMTSAVFPDLPLDPCMDGTVYGTPINAAVLAPSVSHQVTLTGLAGRTTYAVCLKAIDSANNESETTASFQATTLDETPPLFDGLQVIAFNSSPVGMKLDWNPSTSTDVLKYKIRIWKNTASPSAPQITTLMRDAITATDGTVVTVGEFSISDLDEVYAVVDACDDAHTLPSGAQNCTNYAIGTAGHVILPDFNPPQPFAGIEDASVQTTPAQSQILVKWYAPSNWTDYVGFRVFSVDTNDDITLLQQCPCTGTAGSCTTPSPFLQCLVTGLDAHRTYRLHVRGYDSAGNETAMDPAYSFADKQTTDTAAPTFTSGLSIGAGPAFTYTYNAATDNQYTSEPGSTMNYYIYRKSGSTFGNPMDPSVDGTLRGPTTATSYSDSALVEGTTYYVTVCAQDMSGNKTCDGDVKSFSVIDISPPVVLAFTSNHSSLKKRWTLTWNMSDNTTATGSLRVRIYQKNTAGAPATATTADTLIHDATGTPNLLVSGPVNVSNYVNYLIRITDASNNDATAAYSVFSNNVVTVTGVLRSSGPTAGGQKLLIKGTGFSLGASNGYGTNSVVKLGGVNCGTIQVVDDKRILCVTPAASAGSVNVEVDNPEGSAAVVTNGFQYLSSSPHICDNPGSWAQMAQGTGSSGSPFIICDKNQLTMIRNNAGAGGAVANYRTGSMYFRLGDNIDLSSFSFATIPAAIIASFDGQGFAIANLTINGGAAASIGMFVSIVGTVTNLDLLNFDITGGNGVAALAAFNNTQVMTASNLYVNCKVQGSSWAGCITGRNASALGTFTNVEASGTVTCSTGSCGMIVGHNAAASINGAVTRGTVISPSGAGGVMGAGTGTFTIQNLTSSTDVSGGGSNIGGVAGQHNGPISNATASGKISGGTAVGGIVGLHTGPLVTVQDTVFTGEVTAVNYAGGIVGHADFSSIIRSTNKGKVTSTTSGAGGIIGWAQCTPLLSELANEGQVIAQDYGGGIAAFFYYMSAATGGNCGDGNPYILQKSYSTGPISGSTQIGGIVGLLRITTATNGNIQIIKSYSRSEMTGSVGGIGGIVGVVEFLSGGTGAVVIQNSYAAGPNIGFAIERNGIVGQFKNVTVNPTITGVFWDGAVTTAPLGYSNSGTGGYSGSGMQLKTTVQMQNSAPGNIYEAAGWDFAGTWKWPSGTGYPILQWQP